MNKIFYNYTCYKIKGGYKYGKANSSTFTRFSYLYKNQP